MTLVLLTVQVFCHVIISFADTLLVKVYPSLYILARYLSSAIVAAFTAEVSLFNFPDIFTYPDTARFFKLCPEVSG